MAVSWLTIEDLKAYCRNEIPTDEDEHFDEAIDSAVSAVGGEINRPLVVASASPSSRVFRPNRCRRLLLIDDCVAVSSIVENGATLTVSTDYALEPLNGLDARGETVPYSQVRRFSTDWYTDDDKATVSISARWGWLAIPTQLVTATKIVAKDVLMNRDVKFGIVAVTDAAVFSARSNPTVRTAVDRYHLAKAIGGR